MKHLVFQALGSFGIGLIVILAIICAYWLAVRLLEKFFRPRTRFECSLATCQNWTETPHSQNVRQRWLVDYPLTNDDGGMTKLTLCPEHAKEYLNLNEIFYDDLEKTEKYIRDKNLMESGSVANQ